MTGFLTRLATRSLAAPLSAEPAAELVLPRPVSLFEPMGHESGDGLEALEPESPRPEPAEEGRSFPALASPPAPIPPAAEAVRGPAPDRPVDDVGGDVEVARPAREVVGNGRPEQTESPPPLAPARKGDELRRAAPRDEPVETTIVVEAREPPQPPERERPPAPSPPAEPRRLVSSVPARDVVPRRAPPPNEANTPDEPSSPAVPRAVKRPRAAPPALGRPPSRPTTTAVVDAPRHLSREPDAPEPVVHVSIGRVEIRAVPEAAAARQAPSRSARSAGMTLGEYLERRGREGRG